MNSAENFWYAFSKKKKTFSDFKFMRETFLNIEKSTRKSTNLRKKPSQKTLIDIFCKLQFNNVPKKFFSFKQPNKNSVSQPFLMQFHDKFVPQRACYKI
jgi:hypothetical protein